MSISSEVERARYSQQLADYTLRQFTVARRTLDRDQIAASKLPNMPHIDFANLSIGSSQKLSAYGKGSRPVDVKQVVTA
ncbi:hypothetical protein D9758_006395 [Tetrapyrgos nigripes]|uniref:Uncharacterized protein n=1 Tax=Tetrapyrgos nigripes TaxID=182062 RepID=A0A8H5D8Y7_9AGAR|nr:hypothetical protein D9758_006395 [Tetrapyrgos nigripes]